MWVLLGPFDGEAGDSGFQKAKLLKPDTSYTVGRKDRALLINNKKISHDHCDFVVGPHLFEDVSKPSVRPTLKLVNSSKKDKNILISRNDSEVHAYPSSEEPLLDGDIVTLITGVHVTVKWTPICAYTTLNTFKVEECASLGMKLVHTPHDDVTHHMTTHYTADLPCSASLLSLCQFVKPEWLQEVIRLGMLPRGSDQSNSTPLEDHFALPHENKYRPDFGSTLLPPQKTLNVWAPNEERVNLFRTCRFICLHEKMTSTDTELREVLHRGGGLLENFDIQFGIQKFRRALSRSQAKEGKMTVVVGDLDSMQLAVGGDTWKEFMTEARSTSVPVLSLSKIIQAIMDANVDVLFAAEQDNGTVDRHPSADVIPDFVSKEPSMPSASQGSRPRLVRRVNSRPVSRESSVDTGQVGAQDQEPTVGPRRPLTRRVVKSSTNEDQPNSMKTVPPELTDLTAPTPRPTKLKRRFGLTKEIKETTPLSSIEETVREPPLKRFKALFESTNPESIEPESASPMGDAIDATASGVTQTQTDTGTRSLGDSSLTIQREEEEETQNIVAEPLLQRGKKRRLSSEDDVEIQIVEEDGGDTTSDVAGSSKKRRTVENFNSGSSVVPSSEETMMAGSGSKPPSAAGTEKSKTTSGAPPGKPDTDDAFLKAIASTKRGKKNEDEFDREFNKLRITKPELDRNEPEEEWDVLADFGDDSGLRGNFMVIVEIDTYGRDRCSASSTGLKPKSTNCEWDQRPNFKKFKKKIAGVQRTKVDVFASQTENDYGMVESYWKNGHQNLTGTQRVPHENREDLQFQPQSQSLWQENSQTPATTGDAVHELELSQRSSPRNSASRTGSAAPVRSSRKTTSRTRAAIKANPLFLPDDDADQENAVREEDETLKSDLEGKRKPPVRKKTVKKPPSRSRKQPVVVVDDDSDDGVFQGFKAKP